MPTFNNISNGESGLSVRTTLNDVINYVNTGITSGTSFTYITEGTTPGSEYVNILSPRDVYISGGTSVELEYYGSPTITGYVLLNNSETTLHMDDNGVDSSTLTLTPTDITSTVTDGTSTSTLSIYPNEVVTYVTGGTNINSISSVEDVNTHLITDGTDTITITHQSSSLQISSTNSGTTTSTQTIQPGIFTLSSTDGSVTSDLEINIPGGFGGWNFSQGSDNSSIDFQTTDVITTSTDGNTESRIGVYNTGYILLKGDDVTNSITTQIDITPGDLTFTSTDGTWTNTTTIDSDRSINEITDGTINGKIDLDVNNNGIVLEMSDGTNLTTQTITPTTIDLSSTDGNTITKLEFDPLNNVNGTKISQTDAIGSTSISFASDQSFWGGSNVNGSYGNGMVSANQIYFEIVDSGSTQLVSFELDPYNSFNGNRLYSTDGSSTNTLTFSPDYMIWDVNYVTGDTRVGLEFDPSGGLGETRFYKENYVTGETAKLGLNTNSLDFSCYDNNDGTYVSSSPQMFSIFTDILTSGITANFTFDPLGLGGSNKSFLEVGDGTNVSSMQFRENGFYFQSTDGVDGSELWIRKQGITLKNIPSYDDNADAVSNGLPIDTLYITTGLGASPLDVAGILMIRQ